MYVWKWNVEWKEKEVDVWKVWERNVQMKSKRRKCTNEKWRERNVLMQSKRKKCTYEK